MASRRRLAVVRGGGELGTAAARRLFIAGVDVVCLETERPKAVRRAVSFAEALRLGEFEVEGVRAVRVDEPGVVEGVVTVAVDADGSSILSLEPDVVVDARMLKLKADIPLPQRTVWLGPGVSAPGEAALVVETNRGHNLGRVISEGAAEDDTGTPAPVKGVTDRVLWAPAAGIASECLEIGAEVEGGEVVLLVAGKPAKAPCSGLLRGVVAEGTVLEAGEKAGDVDPRGVRAHCFSISDKANAVAGGVLEALFRLASTGL